MKIKQINIRECLDIEDIICDVCGKSCNTDTGFERLTMNAQWGFMTKKDFQKWEADVCEKCVDEKLGFIKFIITKSPF